MASTPLKKKRHGIHMESHVHCAYVTSYSKTKEKMLGDSLNLSYLNGG